MKRKREKEEGGKKGKRTIDEDEEDQRGFPLRTRRSQIRNAAHVHWWGPFGRYLAGICSRVLVRDVARDPPRRSKNAPRRDSFPPRTRDIRNRFQPLRRNDVR